MKENIFLIALHSIWISQKKLSYIFKDTENYRSYFENINHDRLKQAWIRIDLATKILERKNKIDINFLQKVIDEKKVTIISKKDSRYPSSLFQIANPPYILYVRWKLDERPCFSIVGSRIISSYGEKAIERIVPVLGKYFSIVSGWAAWCDTKAHRESVTSNIKTIVVVWTGIDVVYPTGNRKLYEEIIEKWWAILSIFPIGEVGNPYNFPIRNEIISWLAVWTLVVEAKVKSWSLITAQLCLDLWKDLFAIPGDVYKSGSSGCNMLIKKWEAKLTTWPMDILEEYNFSADINLEEKQKNFSDPLEQKIYNIISIESLNSNEISHKIELDINSTLKTISKLELQWIIKTSLGWKYEIS